MFTYIVNSRRPGVDINVRNGNVSFSKFILNYIYVLNLALLPEIYRTKRNNKRLF